MNRSFRILLVTPMNPSSVGGISTVTRNLEKGLEREGHEVQTLFIPFEASERNWKPLDYLPRPRWCYSFKSIKTRRFAYLQNVYRQAQSAITKFEPDIVHSIHIWNWPAIVVANRSGIPTVLSTHALELEEKTLAARAINDADVIHSVSNFTRDLVANVANNEIDHSYVVPPSIEVSKYQSVNQQIRDDPEIVLTLSRFVDRKNVGTIIKSWRHVHTGSADQKLIIAGDGPNQGYLTALTKGVDGVSLVGEVSETYKRKLFSKADVFALVPRQERFNVEGFGIVYIEAQAANTPVVGSSYGGVPEAVGDGGIIVDKENSSIEVANAITRLLNDQEARQYCSTAIEDRIGKFSLRPVARKHVNIYQDLLERHAIRA